MTVSRLGPLVPVPLAADIDHGADMRAWQVPLERLR